MNDLNHYFINRKLTRRKLLNFLCDYKTDGYTLDIGCGDQIYKELFPNTFSVDVDQERHPDLVLDIHHMDLFEDEKFDCILCTEVLEHCYAPWKAVEEMFRVLKPGGILLLSTRFVYPLHDTPHDYYRFTKYGLMCLFNQFRIIEIREESSTKETIGVLYQRLAFQTETSLPFLRLWWFLLAELYSKRTSKLRQYGNLQHMGEPENILTSGYYLALQKPE